MHGTKIKGSFNTDRIGTLHSSLKSCKEWLKINKKHPKALYLLDDIVKSIKPDDIHSKTTLIDIYSECSNIENALHIFNSISCDKVDTVCVGTMMKCFINHNENEKAMQIYSKYNNVKRNDVLKNLYLRAAINIDDYKNAQRFIQQNIDKNNIENHSIPFIKTMIQFYGNTGNIENALDLLNNAKNKKNKTKIFNLILKYYINNDEYQNAISFYDEYSEYKHILIDDTLLILYLKALMHLNQWGKAQKWIKMNIICINNHRIEFINTLIDFYGVNGDIDTAFTVFNTISSNKKDIVSINCIMKALMNNDRYHDALSIYETTCFQHNDISNILYLKCCIKIEDSKRAQHTVISRINDINNHSIQFINCLIEFHAHFGDIVTAENVFHDVYSKKRNIRTINAMIKCYYNMHQYKKAMDLFEESPFEYNDVSYVLYLKCCINIGHYSRAQTQIQSLSINTKYDNHQLMNVLIDFYGKMSDIDNALIVFNNIYKKDIVSINTMMTAYNHCGYFDAALDLFYISKQNGFEMDSFCYSTALLSCGNMVSLMEGLNIIKLLNQHLLNDIRIQSAIISMYSKCGEFGRAIQYYNENILVNDREDKFIASAMMDCYSKIGDVDAVLLLYRNMNNIELNVHRDHALYCIVLNACSHCGVIEDALLIFEEIKNEEYLHPNIITAFIDCFGRTNHLNTAEHLYHRFCDTMDLDQKTKLNILKSLLSSSRIHDSDHLRIQRIEHEIMKAKD